MHWYLVAGAALVVAALAVMGVIAVVTGWVAPWIRGQVVRPKLWGYGAVTGAAGMALFMFIGPFHGADVELAPLAMAGMAVFFVGLALQWVAQRPGRI